MTGRKAAGFIEVLGYLAAVKVADICLKSANVEIMAVKTAKGGLWTTALSGDVGAVRAAVEAAVGALANDRCLVSSHVIARPIEELQVLFDDAPYPIKKQSDIKAETPAPIEVIPEPEAGLPVVEELEKLIDQQELTVADEKVLTEKELYQCRTVDLRHMARLIEDFSIARKKIKFAKKDDLVKAILAARKKQN